MTHTKHDLQSWQSMTLRNQSGTSRVFGGSDQEQPNTSLAKPASTNRFRTNGTEKSQAANTSSSAVEPMLPKAPFNPPRVKPITRQIMAVIPQDRLRNSRKPGPGSKMKVSRVMHRGAFLRPTRPPVESSEAFRCRAGASRDKHPRDRETG